METTDRTPVEQVIAGIWQEVLEVDEVGADDAFLALGGSSLTAMQVIARLDRHFAVELPLNRLLEGTTLREFAADVSAVVTAR
jgi:acyl carrier protein